MFLSSLSIPFKPLLIGTMYQCGNGCEQDYTKALKYYQLSADQGNSTGQNSLGLNSFPCFTFLSLPIFFFSLFIFSPYNLLSLTLLTGYMYANGYGCEQDYTKALKYYQLSADKGNSAGQNNLGRAFCLLILL
jgi:TPR repeat protein